MNALTKILCGVCLALGVLAAPATRAETPFILVASTSSTQNSGLFDHILPIFEEASGIEVRVLAVGTGQALRLARNGDTDVLFVHHKTSEERFVADGFGVRRYDVMYNEFLLVGPVDDPAKIADMTGAGAAMARIAEARAPFVSRGDDSGTASVIVIGKNFDCRIENKEFVAVKRYRARAGDKRAGIQCPAIVAIEIHIIEREAIDRLAPFPSAS